MSIYVLDTDGLRITAWAQERVELIQADKKCLQETMTLLCVNDCCIKG